MAATLLRRLNAAVGLITTLLVAMALAAVPVEGRDERWLDGCAGPGGKAALEVTALAGEILQRGWASAA